MKRLFPLLLALLFLGLQACNQAANSPAAAKASVDTAFPELLDRPAGLGTAEEQALATKRYRDAIRSITKKSEDVKARLQLVELFIWEARITGEHGHYYNAALEMIESVQAQKLKADEQFQALSYKASVLLSLHQFDKALEVAKKAVTLNPYNAQIYGALVDANVELGNYEEAVKMADKMVSIRPDLRSYSRVSYLRELYGEKEGAVEAMEMAVKAGLPGTEEAAWARLTLGDLYYELDQIDMAAAQYERLLMERPNYPFAIAAKAQIEAGREEFEKAEVLLKNAIELIPEVGFYQQLAAIYQATGREKEKQQLVGEILLMLKDDEDHGHKMGLAYAELHMELSHDYKKALTYAMKEYNARPENAEVNEMLAKVYSKMGDEQKAQIHFKKATI